MDERVRRLSAEVEQLLTAASVIGLGRSDEAIAQLRRAKEMDPLSNIIHVGVAWAHYFARQYDQAIEISKLLSV